MSKPNKTDDLLLTALSSDLVTELQFLRFMYQSIDFEGDSLMELMGAYHDADPENIIPHDYIEALFDEDPVL